MNQKACVSSTQTLAFSFWFIYVFAAASLRSFGASAGFPSPAPHTGDVLHWSKAGRTFLPSEYEVI